MVVSQLIFAPHLCLCGHVRQPRSGPLEGGTQDTIWDLKHLRYLPVSSSCDFEQGVQHVRINCLQWCVPPCDLGCLVWGAVVAQRCSHRKCIGSRGHKRKRHVRSVVTASSERLHQHALYRSERTWRLQAQQRSTLHLREACPMHPFEKRAWMANCQFCPEVWLSLVHSAPYSPGATI